MALQLYCPTAHAVLLLAVPSKSGPFHFPATDKGLPGIALPVKPLLGINPQLIEAAESTLGVKALAHKLTINQQFAAKVTTAAGQPASLFVATLDQDVVAVKAEWLTLPELLAAMPKDRNRLPYVLAWQVLTGALSQEVQAVEVDDNFAPIIRPDKDQRP